ncbi:hypothetical protein AAMO2058_000826300 [Amorphochlora amoebiformis]
MGPAWAWLLTALLAPSPLCALQNTATLSLASKTDENLTRNNPEIVRLLSGEPIGVPLEDIFNRSSYLPSVHYLATLPAHESAGIQRYFWEVQNSELEARPVYLSTFPVGKHVAGFGLRAVRHLPAPIQIESGVFGFVVGEDGEMYRVDPWVWSRIEGCQLEGVKKGFDDAKKSWGCFFEDSRSRPIPPTDNSSHTSIHLVTAFVNSNKHRDWIVEEPLGHNSRGSREKLMTDQLARISTHNDVRQVLATQFIASQAVRYFSKMNKKTALKVAEITKLLSWPTNPDAKVASVHLRRGDVAGFNCTRTQHNRHCTQMSDHVARLRVLREKFGITHVYLSCEECKELHLGRTLAPEFTWMSLCEHFDGSIKQKLPSGSPNMNMEVYTHMVSEREGFDGNTISRHVYGFLAELQVASQAHVHVLEKHSCTSFAILSLSQGKKGFLPPHIPSLLKEFLFPFCSFSLDLPKSVMKPAMARAQSLESVHDFYKIFHGLSSAIVGLVAH